MKYDVFISYSRKDSEIVKRFTNELGKAGFSVWMLTVSKQGMSSRGILLQQ